jgi:hypothetical protein
MKRSSLRILFIAIGLVAASCSPLEPLGGDPVATVTGAGTPVGSPASPFKSDTWNLANVSRLQVPFGEIDPIFLDGTIPDAVNYEMVGGDVTRHRVLEWGQLQLKDDGYFRFILQYGRFAVRSGDDLGPTAVCNADLRGVYGLKDQTVVLYPDRFPTERFTLQLDAVGALRGMEMPTNCTGQDGGAPFESNILLRNLVFNAVL